MQQNPKNIFIQFFKYFPGWIIANFIYLTIMSTFRLVLFLKYGQQWLNKEYFKEIANAFFWGLRFDLAVICYINIVLLIIFIFIYLYAYIYNYISNFYYIIKHYIIKHKKIINNISHSRIKNKLLKFISPLKPLPLFKLWRLFALIWLPLSFLLFTIIVLGDFIFYEYFHERLNHLLFGLWEDDTKAVLDTFWKDYSLLAFLLPFSLFIFLYFFIKILNKQINFQNYLIQNYLIQNYLFSHSTFRNLFLFIFLLLLLLGARGNLNFKMYPLGLFHTNISQYHFFNKLCYNGIFAFSDALTIRLKNRNKNFSVTKEMGYQNKEFQAFQDFLEIPLKSKTNLIENLKHKTPNLSNSTDQPVNVIIIIMESLGNYWIQFNNKNFNLLGQMKQHLKEDFYFSNFFPAANGTYHSLISLLLNLPIIPGIPIPESKYYNRSFSSSIARAFKESNYKTWYVYGGGINWRGLSSFIKKQYFDNVVGQNKIINSLKNKKIEEHSWGIFDEYFFDYIWQILQKDKKQAHFFLGLTTTNHPPFNSPKNYQALPLNIPKILDKRISSTNKEKAKNRFLSYQYSCQKLANFISKIKNSSLAKNTIIVVTGDHNFFDIIDFKLNEFIHKWSVPLYIYLPSHLRPKKYDPKLFSSYKDIAPTIYNLVLSNTEYFSFGNDLFNKKNIISSTSTDKLNYYALNDNNIISHDFAIIQQRRYFVRNKNHYKLIKNNNLISNNNNTKDNFNEISKKFRSSLSVIDYFILNDTKN